MKQNVRVRKMLVLGDDSLVYVPSIDLDHLNFETLI